MKLSKKGITSEVLVIVLLIVALAAIVVLWLMWSNMGKGILDTLSNLFFL